MSDPNRAGPVSANPGCVAPTQIHTLATWYNPCAFAVPALAPGQTFSHLFGNARRGSLRGPGAYNIDLSLFKDFKFSESRNLQFRLEAFNLFNHPQFANPANTVDSPGVSGTITSTINSAREVQLALKFSF